MKDERHTLVEKITVLQLSQSLAGWKIPQQHKEEK